MPFTELLPLLLFVGVSTITPGGATTLATASGVHFGYRRSMPFMAGIAAGLGSMAASAAAGLGGILLALPALQLAMKALGSLYLLWLAWTISRNGAPQAKSGSAKPISFLGGVWLLWHNPKGWAMTLGAAAFCSPRAWPATTRHSAWLRLCHCRARLALALVRRRIAARAPVAERAAVADSQWSAGVSPRRLDRADVAGMTAPRKAVVGRLR